MSTRILDRLPDSIVRDTLEDLGTVADEPAGTRSEHIAPLFDVQAARFSRFLRSKAPERRYLLRTSSGAGVLPLEIAGLLASMGGSGKSLLLYQLAVSVATGIPCVGLEVDYVGGALYLAAEDDEEELHRRGEKIVEYHVGLGHTLDQGALGARLHVVTRVGHDNLLTATHDGEVRRTPLVARLIEAARRIPDLRLVAIDPVSRFRGGKANVEEDATRFVEVLEAIREATGAAVLASVHVNKSSIRDSDEADQTAVRGSSALVDGCRWVATMQRLRRDAATEYGVEEGDARHYVRLEIPKSNYAPPFPGVWLHREAGGVLVEANLQNRTEAKEARRQARIDAEYDQVLERVLALIRREGPMTSSHIQRRYSGKAGLLGAGMHTVRGVIDRAIEAGDIGQSDEIGRGGGRNLTAPDEVPDA